MPDDPFKQKWDVLITLYNKFINFLRCLIFTAIASPYRLAFYDLDDNSWLAVDTLVDFTFAVDICLNFFFAYYDSSEDIVDIRKKIAKRYLTTWFIVDFVSIFPISQILNTH